MRQLGYRFHPGHNVHAGRDHTLHASKSGWVKIYRDLEYPDRRYVGVVSDPNDRLPYVEGVTAERRTLGLVDIDAAKRKLLDEQVAYRRSKGEEQ